MQEDINKTLLRFQIEGKKIRKRTARNILIVVGLVTVLILIGYFYPQFSALFVLGFIIGLFGGFYIVFQAIPTLYKPLRPEQYAFQKIVKAVKVLEMSNEPVAFEEVYGCVKNAHGILADVNLEEDVEWYKEVNETFQRLLENLQLIVLPAIHDSKIKKEHLEEIALAIASMNQAKVREVNEMLESSYEKTKPKPSGVEIFLTRIRKSTVGKVLGSLILGYGLVLVVCFLYALGTNQDFMTFLKDRPDIVIIGGLVASGITFWKTK